jgi:hypothetical protein
MNESKAKLGFTYTVQHLNAAGDLLSEEVVDNLVPGEGINYLLNAGVRGLSPTSVWYIGLYRGNYTPVGSITAATLEGVADELTTYDAVTRVLFTNAAATAGTITNVATPAEFVSNLDDTVYGGFISTASAKGTTSGLLLSVVRFAAPKAFNAGDTLRVIAGLTLTSA